ncbi:hypothetical protein SAMD00019534_076090 [Acytostelium subglobosum LB1]|uniref:hypothetical protein n=1 Tax=Acytostelium subglobosum LB1 TaxID=1410327 RepID=UPI000644EBD7|nr:hypothetical protein SAMD00019534_076090 [Acytostelium subglobosum LB1]GAM24434.1 hypothetical protein SAMD00019534_076090 [Acytostelium subglobosum LB1]|eukprot:XP_012752760.1 hypothetical protein SAMD00019534_076090 [Acytostelium subglobosum LB1]
MADDITPNDRKLVNALLSQRNQESTFLGIADKISKKKNKKPSKRIILITKHRVIFLKPGIPKVKKEAHLLDLTEVKSSNSQEVIFITKTFGYGLIHPKADDIINALRLTYSLTFAGCPDDSCFKLDVKPPSRLTDVPTKDLPCGGFVETYSSLCNYFNIPTRDDICWDMANIVSSRNIKAFNFNEIEQPISPGDIKALLGALKWNTYFKSLVFNGIQLGKDQLTSLAETLKTNSTIEDLSLNNVGIKGDTLPIIAMTLQSNKNIGLTSIDLSNNPFEDKGMAAFANYIGASPRGIASLNFANCAMGKAGIVALTNALKKNVKMGMTLSYLDLSNNKMDSDGSASLSAFLASPNSLRTLNIANTIPNMETIVGALVRGCLELRHLDISDNRLTKKEVVHLVRFIGSSSLLKTININNTKIPVENLKEVIMAISSNLYVQDVIFESRNNDLGIAGARMLASLADKIPNIHTLDLAENDFGDEGVSVICDGFIQNNSVKKLSLNGNFKVSKTKSRAAAIESVISLVEAATPLEALHMTNGLSKSQLKNDILPFIYALATNDSLTELDITGHQMGNKGAIALGKALQTNKALVSLVWDENLTSVAGFAGLAVGLERNLTLKNMNKPLIDIMKAYNENPQRLTNLIRDIDNYINRNQSPLRTFENNAGAAIGGTNLSFLASGQQQNIEKLLNKIKSVGRKATDPDHMVVIKDAENTEKVIGGLHLVKEAVHASLEVELNQKLKEFVNVALDVVNQKKKEMMQQIVHTMETTFKSFDQQTYKRLATGIQFGSKDIDESHVEDTLIKGAGAELSNRVHECFLSSLDIASDYTYEKIGNGLESVFQDLIREEEMSHRENNSAEIPPSPETPPARSTPAPAVSPVTPEKIQPSAPKEEVKPVSVPEPTTPKEVKPVSAPVSTPPAAKPPPVPPARSGDAAPKTPEVTSTTPTQPPVPMFKPGIKVSANPALAAAIARGVGGQPPLMRKPVAQEPEATPEPVSKPEPTPQPSAKPKPAAPPRVAQPATPTKTSAPSSSKDQPKRSSGGVAGDITAVPETDTEQLTHITKARPQMQHKRKPPTRRPRPPTE